MHVPLISKNLISIFRLTTNNSAIVEFCDYLFVIKDKEMGKVLMEGTIKDDLYQISAFKTASTSKHQEVSS